MAIDTHDFTGDGRPDAVRVVDCKHGAGSPPANIYVFTASRDGTPRLLQTLLTAKKGLEVGKLSYYKSSEGNGIIGTGYGYSSTDVPRCCPDLEGQIQWEWHKTHFVELAGPDTE